MSNSNPYNHSGQGLASPLTGKGLKGRGVIRIELGGLAPVFIVG